MAKVNFPGAEPPRIFNGEALHARNASLAALKNRHTPSRGYSISVGEVITFPMWKEIEASPATYLKEIDAFVGSRNTAILIRVTRTKGDTRKDSWFDISVLSYAYLDASDKPAYPDELRSRLAEMNSDYERLQSVAGKLLVATGNRIGYKPVFKDGIVQRDEYGHRILEQTNVVTVTLIDKINHCFDDNSDVIKLSLWQATSGQHNVNRESHPYVVICDFCNEFCDFDFEDDGYASAHFVYLYFCKTLELAKKIFLDKIEKDCDKRLKNDLSDLFFYEGLTVEGHDCHWDYQIKIRTGKSDDYLISTNHCI